MDAKIKYKSKKAQVTIFVIIAILIVAAVLLYLLLRKDVGPSSPGGQEANPESFLDGCLKEPLREAIEKISLQGGSVDPILYKNFAFEGEPIIPITYLCYTGNYYEQCVNQEPMLINHIKSEIGNYIEEDVNYCWNEMGKKFQKQGYVVDAQRIRGYDVELKYDYVEIVIDGSVVLTKSGESTREELFNARTSSKTYNIVRLVQEIVSQETVYCNFENIGYMGIYPEWKITKFRTSDYTLIYTVENKKTFERFRFAIRGCVLPGGL